MFCHVGLFEQQPPAAIPHSTRIALWSRITFRAAVTMRSETSSCDPACQERHSITCALLRAIVFVPNREICMCFIYLHMVFNAWLCMISMYSGSPNRYEKIVLCISTGQSIASFIYSHFASTLVLHEVHFRIP